MIAKLKKIKQVESEKFTWWEYLENVLEIICKNEYHSHKAVWPKKIYYELAWLIQICRQEYIKQTKKQIESIEIAF